jgi:hypothetical protein
MIVEQGEDIALTSYVTKNGKPELGLSITVCVKDQVDDTELLASTPLVESVPIPGKYTFIWTGAPSNFRPMIAIYTNGNKKRSETIIPIRSSAGKGSLEADIISTPMLEADLITSQLEGELLEAEILDANLIDNESLEGEIFSEILEGDI